MENNDLELREISRNEWDYYWHQLSRTNMIQSWEYGDAKEATSRWKPIRYVIEDKNNKPIAIFQALILSIPFFGGIARLNRGPLKMYSDRLADNEIVELNIIKAICKEASKKWWWLLFIAPEIEKKALNNKKLMALGLVPRNMVSWGSEVITFSKFTSNEELLASINGKWRNMLRKSQKLSLNVERHIGSDSPIKLLKKNYEKIQSIKGFEGMPSNLLEEIVKIEGPEWKVNVYTAKNSTDLSQNTDLDGMLVSVTHGNTATYLIGYTSSSGRKNNANYLMLWQAIMDAKKESVEFYDLGGLNENTPEGISRFKKGLQADHYDLTGEYRKFII